jgi:hypothetical protein
MVPYIKLNKGIKLTELSPQGREEVVEHKKRGFKMVKLFSDSLQIESLTKKQYEMMSKKLTV